ncbi:MAG: hypothetical protein R3C18_01910 [Planctomycetaceae bacterium]
MATTCPHCDVLLTGDESQGEFCPVCKAPLPSTFKEHSPAAAKVAPPAEANDHRQTELFILLAALAAAVCIWWAYWRPLAAASEGASQIFNWTLAEVFAAFFCYLVVILLDKRFSLISKHLSEEGLRTCRVTILVVFTAIGLLGHFYVKSRLESAGYGDPGDVQFEVEVPTIEFEPIQPATGFSGSDLPPIDSIEGEADTTQESSPAPDE